MSVIILRDFGYVISIVPVANTGEVDTRHDSALKNIRISCKTVIYRRSCTDCCITSLRLATRRASTVPKQAKQRRFFSGPVRGPKTSSSGLFQQSRSMITKQCLVCCAVLLFAVIQVPSASLETEVCVAFNFSLFSIYFLFILSLIFCSTSY